VDPERQELSLFASKRREPVAAIRAKHGDQFDRHVLRTHRPLLVNDVRRDFRFTIAVSPERETSAVIACPLLLGPRPAGVLRLDSPQPAAYNQDDLRFLDILLDLVSTAMTNARLFAQTQQLAITDGLTGLTLRRPFLEQFTRELSRALRSREPVSILMVDVDHFKSYNDAFGHTAGDVVLKSVAEVLRAAVPPDALPARYGGEEFVVLLPRTVRHQASDVAEAIRRQVERGVKGGGTSGGARAADREGTVTATRGVTVSIGLASFPDDAQVDLELIRVADQRLYQAKSAGRNLVCSS
jgi:diguanylate cyclase (GGDEF)-like protein